VSDSDRPYARFAARKRLGPRATQAIAINEGGRWRIVRIMLHAESATAPLPKEYLP